MKERLQELKKNGQREPDSWIGQQIISDAGLKRKRKMLNANN